MQQVQEVPLNIVGSNKFGRYPKISIEETFNMIISDNALVDTGGYKNVKSIASGVRGRALYTSIRGDFMIAVIGGGVYRINKSLSFNFLGSLQTSNGSVYISENNNNEISITDNVSIHVYNYTTAPFGPINELSLDFYPGYISFQNGRMIVAATNKVNGATSWRLSGFNDATTYPNDAQHVGTLQSKPDKVQAAVPFPGRGNLLFLFGETVAESWTDIGGALFPYQRASNFNVDFGCLSPTTIAELDNYIVWLAGNEQSGPVIMYSTGGQSQRISTDGIDFKFAELKKPEDSIGFLYNQDGHVIYQITFFSDNLSYIYDFNTQKFFTVTDENLNYHIARNVVYFNNKYYFVSQNDGNLYEFGTQFTNYQYSNDEIFEIPRIRNCAPIRLPSQRYYIGRSAGFTIENGQYNLIEKIPYVDPDDALDLLTEDDLILTTENDQDLLLQQTDPADTQYHEIVNMAIDLKTSRDGGASFGSAARVNLNPIGKRKSRLIWYQLGIANDLTLQFQFWGFGRFVAFDGVVEVYQ